MPLWDCIGSQRPSAIRNGSTPKLNSGGISWLFKNASFLTTQETINPLDKSAFGRNADSGIMAKWLQIISLAPPNPLAMVS